MATTGRRSQQRGGVGQGSHAARRWAGEGRPRARSSRSGAEVSGAVLTAAATTTRGMRRRHAGGEVAVDRGEACGRVGVAAGGGARSRKSSPAGCRAHGGACELCGVRDESRQQGVELLAELSSGEEAVVATGGRGFGCNSTEAMTAWWRWRKDGGGRRGGERHELPLWLGAARAVGGGGEQRQRPSYTGNNSECRVGKTEKNRSVFAVTVPTVAAR
jgi:hypothetical protein